MHLSFLSWRAIALSLCICACASGCSATDSGYQSGELGNGGFYLSCDDAVACAPGTDDAKKFPKTVAVGSTFSVRFTNDTSAGTSIQLTGASDQGITIDPIATFITNGPQGLSAQRVGIATVAAHDASGQLIDFVNIQVSQPDSLVVYDATDVESFGSSTPTLLTNLQMAGVGDTHTLRAFTQRNKTTLAGTVAIEWTSSDPSVVDVSTTDAGEATVFADASGSATLTAVGASFTQQIEVVVP